jgi:hypothetical protein
MPATLLVAADEVIERGHEPIWRQTTGGRQAAHPRRGPADRSEHRQAAGAMVSRPPYRRKLMRCS